jgi:signal transduction histidine kinase
MCYLWDPLVLWLNVISDSLTALAYYAMPFLLLAFVRRRRDVEFKGIFLAAGVFILACGTTHVLGVLTVWIPVYRLDGVVKAITAVASIFTFAMLVPLLRILVAWPSPAQLAHVNHSLLAENKERRAAEDELRKLNQELEDRVAERTRALEQSTEQLLQAQKMEAMGRLAGGVAHDFNNLLTVILGFNEFTQQALQGDPAALEAAEEVHKAADRASALTQQLLAFSRRQVTQPRLLNLNQVVQNTGGMLRRIIGDDVEVETRLAEDLKLARLDPHQLEQVILNLAVNARDAMPDGGKLTVHTANVALDNAYPGRHIGTPVGEYVMLAIGDSGVGMDDETRARLFEPFFTTKQGGTGLGLAIVYGIVKQNGGDILVYSEIGQGTTFRLYFPVAAAEEEPRVGAVAPEPLRAGGSETILLVEDDEAVRRLVIQSLESLGYRVLDAVAEEAMRAAGEHDGPIDLLLTDVIMPHMSGPELAAKLAAVRPSMRVLFMSGYAGGSVGDKGILAPDISFLQKPFTRDALAEKIRQVLG